MEQSRLVHAPLLFALICAAGCADSEQLPLEDLAGRNETQIEISRTDDSLTVKLNSPAKFTSVQDHSSHIGFFDYTYKNEFDFPVRIVKGGTTCGCAGLFFMDASTNSSAASEMELHPLEVVKIRLSVNFPGERIDGYEQSGVMRVESLAEDSDGVELIERINLVFRANLYPRLGVNVISGNSRRVLLRRDRQPSEIQLVAYSERSIDDDLVIDVDPLHVSATLISTSESIRVLECYERRWNIRLAIADESSAHVEHPLRLMVGRESLTLSVSTNYVPYRCSPESEFFRIGRPQPKEIAIIPIDESSIGQVVYDKEILEVIEEPQLDGSLILSVSVKPDVIAPFNTQIGICPPMKSVPCCSIQVSGL